jgi:hypothetical protein
MSDAPEAAPAPEPAFDDSRRLMGANRTFAGTGTTLTPRGPAARDPAAHQRWAARMAALARALGWPDPQAQARVAASEVQLLAAAPPEVLLTATELSEWAWERTAAEADAAAYAAFGIAQPLGDDLGAAAAEFARRAARERNPALAALIRPGTRPARAVRRRAGLAGGRPPLPRVAAGGAAFTGRGALG